MGWRVYERLGFRGEGADNIVYEVEEEFRPRERPPKMFSCAPGTTFCRLETSMPLVERGGGEDRA
ncbi:hypothetical protein F4809DRAFT_635534 [Biscogniauxia mediterranea]|nr:hypothetical protein F4809DRAFT_635534 [Biscogniauxia mediterranea]